MKLCQNVKSHKSKLSSKLGHVGLKLGHYVKIKKKLVNMLEATVLIQTS